MIKRVIFIAVWTIGAYFIAPMIMGLCFGLFFGLHTFFSDPVDPAGTLVKVLGLVSGILCIVAAALACWLGILGKLPGTRRVKAETI